MTQLILNTKFFIPPQRSDIVARPHLIEKLNQGLEAKLTLISAPAGFGKTTLLSQFLHEKCEYPVAWLSLESEDNDLTRFLSYLAASLGTLKEGIQEAVLSLLRLNQPPEPNTIMTSLINELVDTFPAPFILVLDDYHVIRSPEIHEVFLFLIEHLPPQMHLVILSRENPPFPLARLRVRNQFTEIRADDLRFSHDESALFLNQIMGLDLTKKDVMTLETRTEGWIAGLQMAAISMQGRKDIRSFLQTFSRSNRFIFDYLIEEVLEEQPSNIQNFLLKTSTLDRMCASLCNAITENNDSQRILQELDRANLFVVPLDNQHRWYRYHHLFIDLLRQQLRIRHPHRISELHHQASNWYQDNQLIGEAVHHALVVNDYEKVAKLVEKSVFEGIEHPEFLNLDNWLGSLPDGIMRSKPWLSIAYASILVRKHQFEKAELHLNNADRSLESQTISLEQRQYIQSYAAAIRADLAKLDGDIDQVISWANQALRLLPEKEKRLRGTVLSLLGTALQRLGKFDAAAQALSEGIIYSKAAGDLQSTIEVFGDLAGFFVERGQLHEAFSTCQEAFEFVESSFGKGGRNPLGAAYIYFRLSTILRHWNNLDSSLLYAKKTIEINKQWGFESRLSLINLAIAHQTVGKKEDAMQAIQQAEAIAMKESSFWIADVQSVRALLWLEQGNLNAAVKWAQESGLDVNDDIQFQKQRIYLTLAQVYLAQGQQGNVGMLDKALRLLSRLQTLLETASAQAYVLQILILQALAYQAQKKSKQALRTIERALSLGESGGYIYVFLREGAPMKKLLEQITRQETPHPYTRQLLNTFDSISHDVVSHERASKNLVDPLTKREEEVLKLLSTEISIPGIADELVISVDTVRTHVKRIYSKLDAHSRFEAVSKAREIHLL